ncbi:E3 ubiquitin-protein ligase Mdm2-like isoform X1 [Myxocyprinus asiaticus]|uniref:E3 ubiquitin-protein ligase Mdm2-like isoform X1 n=2 Tax=Myxocyprinus asiaticus TaxID=70543 RepID=UPI002221573B|nr:E3 ubiquitin-protein ligase Mdm2-like isoform X1 [Myxocyprinus asiaticus]XP_051544849.1 E3 ubiquitin-protein ligase Mdm2-like isoform X1 [Myxocyprinus asiaticus]XP_051544850.1 E3 ubiquitin-protein ligase Mdm2-like isoform X1 [Myxocyprinus asiaticus]
MATKSCLSSSQISKVDNEKLVIPKVQLKRLLEDAGADKDVFTMKEVMFYLGKYIMSKELYDKQQQHIVHCGEDPLGAVLGVKSFSVKEPRALFAMISRNLVGVKNPATQSTFSEPRSQSEPDRGPGDTDSESRSSTSQQQRRRRRSSDPEGSSAEDEPRERRKRHKSDSFSLTFDDSLSWCVIGGLHRERGNSESSDAQSNPDEGISHSEDSEESENSESDSDNFSVEFEVESIDSDAYSENDEDSVPGENEVYEVTIFAEDEDSFDEDTEITEADYWKCAECDELNPPLPRHCKSCWTVRPGWLPDMQSTSENNFNTQNSTEHTSITTPPSTDRSSASYAKLLPSKPSSPLLEIDEGVDVPDGKCLQSPAMARDNLPSQNTSSQPSTSSGGSSQEETPELERYNSLEACLPTTCLEPCVICQSRPKNGCIVHGRTGHLMACYTCAKKLKNRNKLCPVCREPIQSVVLTYVS